jgi:sigma54-dependent transcription regulator
MGHRGRMDDLLRVVSSEPSGPIVVFGPEGAGKSLIARQVLQDRKFTIYLNMRMQLVEQFSRAFALESGFYLPSVEIQVRPIRVMNIFRSVLFIPRFVSSSLVGVLRTLNRKSFRQ